MGIVMATGGPRDQTPAPDSSFLGFHQDGQGSFEVFHQEGAIVDTHTVEGGVREYNPGFYWWSCSPGCLPDGESNGPFETAYEAYDAACGYGGEP